MGLNKRGTSFFLVFMLGIVCFILGMALTYPIVQTVQDGQQQMNCSTATDYQTKANCTSVDMFIPLLIGTLFGLAGMLIGGKLL